MSMPQSPLISTNEKLKDDLCENLTALTRQVKMSVQRFEFGSNYVHVGAECGGAGATAGLRWLTVDSKTCQ